MDVTYSSVIWTHFVSILHLNNISQTFFFFCKTLVSNHAFLPASTLPKHGWSLQLHEPSNIVPCCYYSYKETLGMFTENSEAKHILPMLHFIFTPSWTEQLACMVICEAWNSPHQYNNQMFSRNTSITFTAINQRQWDQRGLQTLTQFLTGQLDFVIKPETCSASSVFLRAENWPRRP